MGDIIKAIEKEKEYLSYRMKGEEPYSLREALKEFGFDSLSEFHKAKTEYNFIAQSFEIVDGPAETATEEVFKAIDNQTCKAGFLNVENTIVLSGSENDANTEYCNKCNIPIYPYYTKGGSTVATKGDLLFGLCSKRALALSVETFLDKLADIFHKYSPDDIFTVSHNDILRNGKKFLGSAIYYQNEMLVIIVYISFSDKHELIEQICLKHSEKEPDYVDFMTRSDFRQEVLEWLNLT